MGFNLKRAFKLAGVVSLLLLYSGCAGDRENQIIIGGKNFTEQVVLNELLAQHLENRTGLTIVRKANLGGTFICHRALLAGEIDLYAEYTGTALMAILDLPPSGDPDAVYAAVSGAYREQFDAEWMEPLGFNDTFAIIVRRGDAEALGLKTISDLVAHAPKWRPGFSYEFAERPDGFRGMVATYGLEFGETPRTMEIGLMYRALRDGLVDVIAGNSTEGIIDVLDLFILEDDRKYFPPYYAAPVIRRETLERHPQIREALGELGGLISEEEMRRMNHAVDGEGQPLRLVVAEFLAAKGLAPGSVSTNID